MASEREQSDGKPQSDPIQPQTPFRSSWGCAVEGAICLDTLSSAWSPVLTIKSALLSLQSLLSTPEPKDPQDAEVAGMLMRNPKEFDRVARDWAHKHAGAPKRERGEGSGGTPSETPRQREQRSREEEERARLAAYVNSVPSRVF